MARSFVETWLGASMPADSRRAVAQIDGVAEREARATAAIAARFSARPVRAVEVALSGRGPLQLHLRDLRRVALDLDRADGSGRVDEFEDRIRALVAGLEADRLALETDNALLAQQERALFSQIRALRRYALLAARLDELVHQRVEALDARSAAAGANAGSAAIANDVLYAVRRRRRDVLMQLAVATQGYASLRIIEQNNLEVIWSIRTALTTTVTAFRTALLARDATSSARSADGAADGGLHDLWSGMIGALDDVERRRAETLRRIKR